MKDTRASLMWFSLIATAGTALAAAGAAIASSRQIETPGRQTVAGSPSMSEQAPAYRNPVLEGDYSDPDAIRVGEDFYLVASSFSNVPGLPILHSRDLVHWTLIGHALPRLPPDAHYGTPRRGGGVWAPAIVHHRGLFRIYWPDPDRGIFVVTARHPRGPWTKPALVDATRGAIDPAPFFDSDGSAWLAHAFAGSRAGFSNVIVLKRMDPTGSRTIDAGRRIVEGDRLPMVRTSIGMRPWQTTEGPKLYRRDGWYWLFVPSGSVKGGWQGVFRARHIEGPWEGRDVLDQGTTDVNGPHQGAWVRTAAGKDWFLHFQDTDSYGRRVHLEPMRWRGGWPVIGEDPDDDGIGQPVRQFAKPSLPPGRPDELERGDEFGHGRPSLQWQWNSNPAADWVIAGPPGWLRLKAASQPSNLWEAGNLLSRKLPGERFSATVKMRIQPLRDGERAGLALFGSDYAWIGAERRDGRLRAVRVTRLNADAADSNDVVVGGASLPPSGELWLRMVVKPITVENPPPDFHPYWPSMLRSRHARAQLLYSVDGSNFVSLGPPFASRPGRWVGAQIGIFAQAPSDTPAFAATSVGHTDFDWVRFSY